MRTYSSRQVAVYCAVSVVVTVVFLAVFRVVLWPTLENRLGFGPARVVSIYDPGSDAAVREGYEEMVARRDLSMSLEDQYRLQTLFHEMEVWGNLYWLGIKTQKNPLDMWMFQQVLADVRPDFVIEAGTLYGGSALYYAHMLDGLGLADARVITIDIEDRSEAVSRHPLWQERVDFIHASSTDAEVVADIRGRVAGSKVVVTLDSDHRRDHVFAELQAYAPVVPVGSYIVVEDTNMDGIPLYPDFGPGPMAAVDDFLATELGQDFEVDRSREAFLMTFNPRGWLRRVR